MRLVLLACAASITFTGCGSRSSGSGAGPQRTASASLASTAAPATSSPPGVAPPIGVPPTTSPPGGAPPGVGSPGSSPGSPGPGGSSGTWSRVTVLSLSPAAAKPGQNVVLRTSGMLPRNVSVGLARDPNRKGNGLTTLIGTVPTPCPIVNNPVLDANGRMEIQFVVPALAPGVYELTVSSEDAKGNLASGTTSFTVS